MAANTSDSVALLPMKIDCFVLNEAVCTPEDANSAKIAPLAQPNYTFLRYEQKYLASDLLRHTDLHATTGQAKSNSRFTDLGTGNPIKSRQGVYVHWMIPRPYRFASSSSQGDSPDPSKDIGAHKLSTVPNRWLVIRHTDLTIVKPNKAASEVPELVAWVVESDYRRSIDDFDNDDASGAEEVDIQTEVSPFIAPALSKKNQVADGTDNVSIAKQAEVFIGSKWPAATWTDKQNESQPRVELNLADSSNLLFADFQPHNSNVFSIIDPMEYGDNRSKVESATVSYYVIGWQSEPGQDLLAIPQDQGSKVTRGGLFDALSMVLKDSDAKSVQDWTASSEAAKTLVHGAIYEVHWNLNERPTVPADEHCANLMADSTSSIGTTPMDALLAFAHAHQKDAADSVKVVLDNLLKLEQYLIAREDSVESQRRAADIAGCANFKRTEGGKHVYFSMTNEDGKVSDRSGESTKQIKPSQDNLKNILISNQDWMRADSLNRLGKKLQWDMFTLWWSYVSDAIGGKYNGKLAHEVEEHRTKLRDMNREPKPPDFVNEVPANAIKIGVREPFYQPNDPTLLVSRVPSGWPRDYLEKLQVRLAFQTLGDGSHANVPQVFNNFNKEIIEQKILSKDLREGMSRLLEEFALLSPLGKAPDSSTGTFLPLYHDNELDSEGKKDESRWRDRWNGVQPFFPLYLEWELEYLHIPFSYWKLQDTTVVPSSPSRVHYQVDHERYRQDALKNPSKFADRRVLSGRSLILPQPGFSLEARIKALFSQLPEKTIKDLLDGTDPDVLLRELPCLPFLSTPLNGFTDHLLTRLHGAHVKPNNRLLDGTQNPIRDAVDAASRIGFKADDLKLIGAESDLTPYGTTVQYIDDTFSSFKPVTHGQFQFTKLNIIDKFGQAIHAIDPSIEPETITTYPCSGEYFGAQRLLASSGGELPGVTSQYNYLQIPPQINQPARMNADFVVLDTPTGSQTKYWKPTTEWENPVWGWVVINYVSYGIQLFKGDGAFFCEVRLGGPNGTLVSPEWRPFKPGDMTGAGQLSALIKKLSEKTEYFRGFVSMIENCMSTLSAAPRWYSDKLNALVGRPLALVNTAWSIELATEPYESKALAGITEPPQRLTEYSFEVKLGSKEKAYDALVGYFPCNKPAIGGSLDFTSLLTYYVEEDTDHIHAIGQDFPKFKPFYHDPTKYTPAEFYIERCRRQSVFGAIMDPFAAIHAYSSILPIKELRLPPDIVQEVFSKITTLFDIGPLLFQSDIPEATNTKQVWVSDTAKGSSAEPALKVPVPASTLGKWNWLQPYASSRSAAVSNEPIAAFARLGLEKVDHNVRFEETPYSAGEGYLQLL